MSLLHVYVGAYTHELSFVKGKARGLALYALDTATGRLDKRSEAAADNPSFLAIHPSGKFLYAVNESTQWHGSPDDAISAFAIAADGALTLLNRQPSLGSAPCFIEVDTSGKFAMTANYVGGNFVIYPIGADGKLAPASHNAPRNPVVSGKTPHAHSINLAPGGKFALACDLGLDKIFSYQLDLTNGALLLHAETALPAGSGPRHLDFHPNERFVYVINELGKTLTVFNWNGNDGLLNEIQTISTVPANGTGTTWCADVHVLPGGKFVYASNRGHDSIVIYAVDQVTGKLTLVGHQPTLGKIPRNFAITPDGTLLLVANQDSDNIVVFRIDPANGQLAHLATNDSPTPVCIKFAASS